MSYADKVVAVMGASTGLGRSIAVACAERGARAIIITYATSEAEARTTADLVARAGAQPLLVQADVAEDADCRRVADAAAPHGRLDVLFNNAGTTRFARDHTDLDAVSAEDFLWIYRVNVVGAYQMVRAARPLLEAAGRGAVVNTSSIAGVTGIGSSVAYAASKGALNTLTLSLARALAPRIRVNAVCPGFIDTGWFGRTLDDEGLARLRHDVAARTPLKAASGPDDIAASAVFLGGEDSRHITGETLLVDAGTHLGYAPLVAR